MEYVYPAVFHPNSDGSFTITYPDLPGCISEGKDISNALVMSQSALRQWIEYLNDRAFPIPKASDIKHVSVADDEFVSLVRIETKDGRAVKRTISIPKWMDDKVIENGLSLSRVVQDALSQRFN